MTDGREIEAGISQTRVDIIPASASYQAVENATRDRIIEDFGTLHTDTLPGGTDEQPPPYEVHDPNSNRNTGDTAIEMPSDLMVNTNALLMTSRDLSQSSNTHPDANPSSSEPRNSDGVHDVEGQQSNQSNDYADLPFCRNPFEMQPILGAVGLVLGCVCIVGVVFQMKKMAHEEHESTNKTYTGPSEFLPIHALASCINIMSYMMITILTVYVVSSTSLTHKRKEGALRKFKVWRGVTAVVLICSTCYLLVLDFSGFLSQREIISIDLTWIIIVLILIALCSHQTRCFAMIPQTSERRFRPFSIITFNRSQMPPEIKLPSYDEAIQDDSLSTSKYHTGHVEGDSPPVYEVPPGGEAPPAYSCQPGVSET